MSGTSIIAKFSMSLSSFWNSAFVIAVISFARFDILFLFYASIVFFKY